MGLNAKRMGQREPGEDKVLNMGPKKSEEEEKHLSKETCLVCVFYIKWEGMG